MELAGNFFSGGLEIHRQGVLSKSAKPVNQRFMIANQPNKIATQCLKQGRYNQRHRGNNSTINSLTPEGRVSFSNYMTSWPVAAFVKVDNTDNESSSISRYSFF
jgi:hypothetical protein